VLVETVGVGVGVLGHPVTWVVAVFDVAGEASPPPDTTAMFVSSGQVGESGARTNRFRVQVLPPASMKLFVVQLTLGSARLHCQPAPVALMSVTPGGSVSTTWTGPVAG